MLTTIIEVAVILICLATATYLLVEGVRRILRFVCRRRDEGSKPQGPPDLFGGL